MHPKISTKSSTAQVSCRNLKRPLEKTTTRIPIQIQSQNVTSVYPKYDMMCTRDSPFLSEQPVDPILTQAGSMF